MEENKINYQYYEYPDRNGDFPIGNQPVSLNYLGFYICEQGEVSITLDNQRIALRANNICVVMPGSILGIDGYTQDFRGYGARASNLFVTDLRIPNLGNYYAYIRNNPCLSISTDKTIQLKGILKAVNAKMKLPRHPLNTQIIQSLLNALAYEILYSFQQNEEEISTYNSTRQDEIFREFMLLVNSHHKQERGLAHYADIMCLTTRYLSSVIKQKTGKSASHWINLTVIAEAKNMLRNSDMSVLQVSDELNFANPSFFGQYFKKYAGITPMDYKRGKE